jgi:hypothetical protein
MYGQDDNTAPKRLSPRSGMRRLINLVVYRHLRGVGSRILPVPVSRPPRASCASRTASTHGQLSSWLLRRAVYVRGARIAGLLRR